MKKLVFLFAIAVVLLIKLAVGHTADYAVILTEPERAAMIEALDIATRAQGLAIVRKTLPLWEKLVTAPVVTDQRPADQEKR